MIETTQAHWKTVVEQNCSCGQPQELSPSAHSGLCPAWSLYHKLTPVPRTGRWVPVFAGFYRRIGSDGTTVLAEVSRDEDGTWSYTVRPFGRVELGWQATGYATLAEAKRMAEVGYRRYMTEHRAMNA
jgi:hypothetical protein